MAPHPNYVNEEYLLYDEIDLRVYVNVLLRNWYWIVGAAFVAAVGALLVTMALPPVYEASALVAITKPQYVLAFDTRVNTQPSQAPYKAYTALATSDDVLVALWAALQPPPADLERWQDLRGVVEVSSDADPSLLRLAVRSKDPQQAVAIANAWAETFVSHSNAVYARDDAQAGFFTEQVAQAQAALEAADAALIAFQSQNDARILANRLESELQAQADYLTAQREIAYLIQDVQGLRAQLAQSRGDVANLGDQLTALLLQIKAFNAQSEVPLQLQISNPEALDGQSVAEQVAFLDELVVVLEARSEEAEEKLAALEPDILALQAQVQQKQADEDRLMRVRDLARETQLTLARKAEERRIAAADTDGDILIASHAAATNGPVSPRKMMATAIAGVLGGAVAVTWVFGAAWWRGDLEARPGPSRDDAEQPLIAGPSAASPR